MSANKQTPNRPPRPSRSTFQRLARRFMSGLLRSLFFINKPVRHRKAGFVLPTTVLLLLVMTLTVGALTFRSASRTQSAFLAREQQVIDNVAAPAIDRAKSKLEYLFSRDSRMPGTDTPSSDIISTLMLNITSIGADGLGITRVPNIDPYTLPDEVRIDLNGDDTLDNAWSFAFDIDGDGNTSGDEIIAYSILMDDAVDPLAIDGDDSTDPTPQRDDDIKIEDTGVIVGGGPGGEDLDLVERKARNLITRNGPLNTNNSLASCGASRAPAQGWLAIGAPGAAALEKNFQITAFVSNGKDLGRANSALELQQVRLAQRGNTWGAWFKYDLEVHPGPNFNWNGAIHTDGNMLVTNNLRAHMISSHNSCLYSNEASAITMAEVNNDGVEGVIVTEDDSEDFQGQLIAGVPGYGEMNGRGNPGFHLSTGPGSAPTTDNNLNSDNDSVTGNTFSHLTDIAMDPIALFTLNESRHRRTGTWTRDEDWSSEAFNTSGRVTNQEQDPPFLDDFFRADNRYGPKPNYEKYKWVEDTDEGVGGAVTTTRNDPDYDKRIGDEIISTDPRADNLTNATDGLDGYWERKSIANGMRLVVGQRLELGNSLGWNSSLNGATTDPIYPPEISNLRNKQLQRVMLKDNLAAVQGMVVYHYGVNNGLAPLACVANTVHPGTLQTLRASRTFDASASGALQTDFFGGRGTNGWEFSYPAALDSIDAGGDVDETEFGAALSNNQPMGIALRNLAHFAGDPNGGSPSFMPVQDTNVHPFPHQSMWGDFSVLRRIFDDYLDSGTWRSAANPPQLTSMGDRYVALSPADKASLQSAACTMGLLAYNVDTVLTDYTTALSTGSALEDMGPVLSQLIGDDANSIGEILGYGPKSAWSDANEDTVFQDEDGNDILDSGGTAICPAGADGPGFQANCDTAEYYEQFAPEDWADAYESLASPTPSSADMQAIGDAIALYRSGNQILRDRTLGFRPGNPVGLDALMGVTDEIAWNADTGLTEQQLVAGENAAVKTTCDPDIFNQIASNDSERMGFALLLCAPVDAAPIRYPSLYYLFPMVDHDHDGAIAAGEAAVSPAFAANHSQPGTEEYIDRVSTYAVNNGYIYQVLGDTNGDNVDNNGENGYSAIAFIPRANDGSDWVLPTEFLEPGPLDPGPLDPGSMDIQVPNGGLVALSLLDKAMYNGREEMLVRILDLDLQKLTRNTVNGGDYWISDNRDTANGLVYGVREDAMREDAITRPAAAAWTSCNTLTTILSDTCWMRPNRVAGDGGPTDPPLSRREDGSLVGISTKPVDFAPDPDRRPHGFRLKAALDGNDGDLSDRTNRLRGLTFVTDNAAYIQGEFNPHTSDGSNTIEEFTQTLFNNNVGFGGAFYSGRTTVDNTFASAETDRWRVAEVLADAVYLLSNNYVDGSVEDGFILDLTQTSADFGGSRTSFQNQQRPVRDNNQAWGKRDHWYRIDGSRGASGGDTTLPIWVGRNGESMARGGPNLDNDTDTVFADAENGNFELPNQRTKDALIDAPTERMNATIISGIVPSRSGQGYGGLHNFPRFLEDWGGSLFIQGAFLQLNFSTAGTGPFDADAWDPGDTPISNERIKYYGPPARRWGYDVALQFVPAGPISQRFVSVGKPRSEHYRELPIEDPYVATLRCSRFLPDPNDPGSFENRFPDVSDEDCPNRP